MARGNRDSAVRGNRGTYGLGARRRIESEVESTIRDGMEVFRLVFRGVSLVVCYHEGGETEEAFNALRSGVASLIQATCRSGPGAPATTELVLESIEDELDLMYDTATAGRLSHALRQCSNRPIPGGHR